MITFVFLVNLNQVATRRQNDRMIVADASPLIALAKLGRLTLLRDLYGVVLIGSTVEAETVTAGRAVRALGVEQIEAALADGWLQTTRLSAQEDGLMQRFMAYSRLDRGEAESIALANARSLPLIVDDKEARAVAAVGSVAHVGTAGVLLEACLRRRLDLEELETTLRDLTQILWLSPAVVAEVLRLARGAAP